MPVLRLGLLFAFAILFSASLTLAQQTTTSATAVRDPQALNILAECLTAAGGAQAISGIQDFTETGNITYFWAGQQTIGSVTVRGLGTSYFRLDADLSQGTRSWAVNGLAGTTKNADGSLVPISYANAVNMGSLTLPYLSIAAVLNDSSISVSTVGTTTVNGRQGTMIQVQKIFSSSDDPSGELTQINTKSYIVDSQSFVLLETEDTLWSSDGRMLPTTHELIFSNFNVANGITVPFSIEEMVGGQQTWSLQLATITFNSGLTTGIFQF